MRYFLHQTVNKAASSALSCVPRPARASGTVMLDPYSLGFRSAMALYRAKSKHRFTGNAMEKFKLTTTFIKSTAGDRHRRKTPIICHHIG
jgi:hypothetical protein